jgi:hypothetical protein
VNARPAIRFSRARRRLLSAFPALLVAAPALAQSGARVKTRPASTTRFRVDLPERDWRLVPGGVNTLGTLTHKDEPVAVVIEYEQLQIALNADEIDTTFAELEAGTIKDHEPNASGLAGSITQVGRRKMAMVNYQRRGVAGPEQVRVLVLVQGRNLYRLVCSAPVSMFVRYAPLFQQLAESFTPLNAGA